MLSYDDNAHSKYMNAGKFVAVNGTVVRVSCIKPLCVRMAYECIGCNHIQVSAFSIIAAVLFFKYQFSGCTMMLMFGIFKYSYCTVIFIIVISL